MEESTDLFCYTKREEFTSEVFKIEIEGLPAYFGYKELKNLLNQTLKLNSHKIKTGAFKPSWTFVTFKCEEDREKALKVLEGYKWRGCTLSVKKANPAADPLIRKRQLDDDAQKSTDDTRKGSRAKRGKGEEGGAETDPQDDVPFSTKVKDVVMPLWKLPYEEQLQAKMNDIRSVLTRLGQQIKKTNPAFLPWLAENKKQNDGMCCPLATPVRTSSALDGYRNKCEFTVGRDPLDRTLLNVGFRLAKYADGSMAVADPSECTIVPPAMLAVAKSFEHFVRSSGMDAFDPETHEGNWRQLTVRSNRDNDHLVIAYIHPQQLSKEDIDRVKKDLNTFFFEGAGSSCNVKALFFIAYAKRDGDDTPPEHIGGEHHIVESLSEHRLRISPLAFFQVNTTAAEVLYQVIAEVADLKPETFLLDVCCGTAPIAISLAKKVKKVVGIEMVESAVEDAKHNVQLNGLTNVQFTCGKVEDTLSSILYLANDSKDVVAIVDPPRPGLHNKVIKTIRAARHLNRLVYVSCNPSAAITNFLDLCRPESKQFRRNPFVPIRATAVDLFPHTKHCELVILFERTPDQ